ncbi:hypothetical protein ACEPAI_8673 [Sanghuangporus weigelae]
MWNVDLRLGHFFPGFLVPLPSYPSVAGGFLLLCICIFTLTSPPMYQTQSTLIRLALVPPAVWLFWNFGFETSYNPPGAQVAVGMAVVGLYGVMRIIDTSIVTLIDRVIPFWVHKPTGKVLPTPTSMKDRLAFTIDYATSLRGTSYFSDRHWNWVPTPLIRCATKNLSRPEFLMRSLRSIVLQYFILDVLDSINKSRKWDAANRFPITSLSIPEQILFSISVCVGTTLPIIIMHEVVASVAVALGSSPASWPPMFDRPFHSTSLADFWSRRWHAIFRRVFVRLSTLVLTFLPIPNGYTRLRIAARAITIFALSASLHILLMYRLELSNPSHPSLLQTFLDRSILTFFLVQPVGLAVEALVVRPLVVKMSASEKAQRNVMRMWAWGFMLWSGRYWSDVWVKRGMWGETEHVVGYSLVRGLLKGQWKT